VRLAVAHREENALVGMRVIPTQSHFPGRRINGPQFLLGTGPLVFIDAPTHTRTGGAAHGNGMGHYQVILAAAPSFYGNAALFAIPHQQSPRFAAPSVAVRAVLPHRCACPPGDRNRCHPKDAQVVRKLRHTLGNLKRFPLDLGSFFLPSLGCCILPLYESDLIMPAVAHGRQRRNVATRRMARKQYRGQTSPEEPPFSSTDRPHRHPMQ